MSSRQGCCSNTGRPDSSGGRLRWPPQMQRVGTAVACRRNQNVLGNLPDTMADTPLAIKVDGRLYVDAKIGSDDGD